MTGEPTVLEPGAEFLARFGRHFAHELNNPIGAISSAVFLIEDFMSTGTDGSVQIEQIQPFVESIREECDQLRELVQEFVKFVSTDRVLALPLDLVEFLGARAAEMAREGLPVTFEESRTPEMRQTANILGDAGSLGTVLRLLTDNAVDRGAKYVRIGQPQTDDRQCLIHIRDNRQPQLSPEVAQQLFEVNFDRRNSGLGLKLPFIRKVIELHNGSIEAKSENGELDICIRLPIVASS
ncbi:MAG: HAMP domain-containing sensor histidine kinase [Bacteroidota bacterium]|nr:HAMP domain-containing sensor histidine kinase [Bacteroidota bacterium]MDP4233285.1 HAMP domain-containing sensor histidine kinase [Bacteroidota bacterium]MDP4242095.1 HAMP domain-containing sensor histidine kinase [Bacteroidota bacterium]